MAPYPIQRIIDDGELWNASIFLTLIYDGKKLKTLKILLCFSITHFLGRIAQLNVWHYFAQGCKLSCQPLFLVVKTFLALLNIM
jgi:hypothetical protein